MVATLTIAARAGLGILLALVFSMVGVGLAWVLYSFSGALSRTTLEVMFIAGAGLGAGLGGILAWLRLDGNPRSRLIPTTLMAVLVSLAGAWAGYDYGVNREVECCTKPEIAPFSSAAYGAVLAVNGALLFLGIARKMTDKRRSGSYLGGPEL